MGDAVSKVIISLSGGMDSAVLLATAVGNNHAVLPVRVAYGGKHGEYEGRAALQLCGHYKLDLMTVDMAWVGGSLSSHLLKGGGDVPEGHYTDDSMRLTVVPGRNLLIAAALAAIAESRGYGEVWMGMHAGDRVIYPDCRPEFVGYLRYAVLYSSDQRVNLQAPLLIHNKADVVRLGTHLNVPFGKTRSCYKDQPVSCGRCGACVERLEAFRVNNLQDPLEYEQ